MLPTRPPPPPPPAPPPERTPVHLLPPRRRSGTGGAVESATSHARAVRVRERVVYHTVAKRSIEVPRFLSILAPGLAPSARPLVPSRSSPLPHAPAFRAPPCSTARLLSSPAQGPRPGCAPPTPSTLHSLAPSVVESLRLAAPPPRRLPSWVTPTVPVEPPPTAPAGRAAPHRVGHPALGGRTPPSRWRNPPEGTWRVPRARGGALSSCSPRVQKTPQRERPSRG